jgi:hypothetical protein
VDRPETEAEHRCPQERGNELPHDDKAADQEEPQRYGSDDLFKLSGVSH